MLYHKIIQTPLIPGKLNILPKSGTLRKKFIATGKKLLKEKKSCSVSVFKMQKKNVTTHLNNKKNPYDSIIMPTIGHPNKTIVMPPKNANDALIFCRLKKNLNVRSSPITQAKPQMNKIYIEEKSS